MINWYKVYDEETKDQSFQSFDYSKYSPYDENCIFTVHYFEEIKHNFFRFEQGLAEIILNNDHFCSKCQTQLLKQSQTLCTIFKTESLLCEIPTLRELAQKAVRFFEAERFYYFSFWNAVINDKQFLLTRLKCSYARFYRFLIDLNTILLPVLNDPKLEQTTYKELQTFLVNTYKALILEIEHFDYLYPDFVKIIKIICEISAKLTDNIQLIIANYSIKDEEKLPRKNTDLSKSVLETKKPTIEDTKKPKSEKSKSRSSSQSSDSSSEISEAAKADLVDKAAVNKMIDIGVVKKNLRKVFHEKKLQRYQKQKQKLDQQLANKGRKEMSSLKQYFNANLEKQDSNLYYFNELLNKHHLNNIDIRSKIHITGDVGSESRPSVLNQPSPANTKSKTIFENKEYKESPNNPNYRYERIMRMMEEKKRKNLDDYISSLSREYFQAVRDTWINFADNEEENINLPNAQNATPKEPQNPTPQNKIQESFSAQQNENLQETIKKPSMVAPSTTGTILRSKHTYQTFVTPILDTMKQLEFSPSPIPMETLEKHGREDNGYDMGDSEVSDESVFTDEEKQAERQKLKSAFSRIGLDMLKKVKMETAIKSSKHEPVKKEVETVYNFILEEEEGEDEKKKKKKDTKRENIKQAQKPEDWVTHFSFNELIKQKKFGFIPKKPGVRLVIDKKPNKYRSYDPKKDLNKDDNGDIMI